MRRSVFFAVWLGLVLSLLKESSTLNETAAEPTELPTSEPTELPTSEPTETTAETSPETTVMSTSIPTESSTVNGTATEPTGMTTSEPTETSTVNETATEPTGMTTSEPTVDFCRGDPCGSSLATCISLQSNYICVCQYGFYYSNENCYRGKVFPATITVRAPYSDRVQIVNSTEYEEVFNNVSAFFKKAIGNLTGYIETVIVEIQPTKSRSSVSLNVTVTNLFMWNSTENDTTVGLAVRNAIRNDTYVSSYAVAKHCDIYRCDTKTTECQEGMFPECKCKPDLEKTEWDDRSCSACSKSCSAEANKYCVKAEEGPTCKCMTNFKTDSGKCVPCRVGYSGEECTNNSELILIIVGTVFGAIILSLVIAVSVVSVRAKHKRNPEKRSLMKSGYSDMNTSDDRPSMFPRVQTTSGHTNPGYQPNNPYEMCSTNRDHFPERDYNDMYEISREPRGFRMQSKY